MAVVNVNNGGVVDTQSNDDDKDGDVVNVNNGGTVGIQGGTVSGNTVEVQR